MRHDKFNNEGYLDPTHYAAMQSIEREERKKHFRPVVYISCPADSDESRFCRFAMDMDCIPIAPHMFFSQILHDLPEDEELLSAMSMILLTKCREVWVFGDFPTKEMQREIEKANYRFIPVRYFTDDCREVFWDA